MSDNQDTSLSTQEIGEIIKSRVEVTHDKALVFAKLAQGNPGRAGAGPVRRISANAG